MVMFRCEIFAKICTHQISTVPFYNTTNPACNVTVNVIIHTTPEPHTTTPRPVTEFEVIKQILTASIKPRLLFVPCTLCFLRTFLFSDC